jgi:hypothetical protein
MRTLLKIAPAWRSVSVARRCASHEDALCAAEGRPGQYTHAARSGNKFRALDKTTGNVLWQTEFSHGSTGTPMTYSLNEKQFLVVTVGGEAPEFATLALPQAERGQSTSTYSNRLSYVLATRDCSQVKGILCMDGANE